MISRCNEPKKNSYPRYGGRGIKVCDQWQGPNGYLNFLYDMGRKPDPKMQIDRKDNNGNYEPSNCRWATRKEQNRNSRNNHLIIFNGETQPLCVWAERFKISAKMLSWRIENGWPIETAIKTPKLIKGKYMPTMSNVI
jgi:hypothetical protein